MMTESEKRGVVLMADKALEEERLLMEDVTVLDFDMLCSTVALQAHKGKWGELNEKDNEDASFVSGYQYGGGGAVFRMWEGEIIYDCFDDRRLAFQSTCCPCYRFGKNMKRAGFGSCFLQGSFQLILFVAAISNLLAFIFTGKRCFVYLAIIFTVSVGTYMGFFRTLIRKKFNIKGSDSCFDDCVYHLICPCCTLCQESRTLEMNNVADGIWHGRGDTICIGTVSTKSPECLKMERNSDDSIHLSAAVDGDSFPLVPPSE